MVAAAQLARLIHCPSAAHHTMSAAARALRIDGVVRRYDWGSTSALQDLLGMAVDGEPLAEVWYGAHRDGPSPVTDARGDLRRLLQAAGYEPRDPQGGHQRRQVVRAGSARELEDLQAHEPLPYLLKLLAPGRSVSLQVHPDITRARRGATAELAAGIARDDPRRRYKDPHHKPEMVLALTPFAGLMGFADPSEVHHLLRDVQGPLAHAIDEALQGPGQGVGLAQRRRAALTRALHAGPSELADFTARLHRSAHAYPARTAHLAVLAEQHPGDTGVAAAALLKSIVLEPGQACFVPAGALHAYASGIAVEVMASCDTVLRAGLTTKLVDVEALLDCVEYDLTCSPEVPTTVGGGQLFTPAAQEFALWSSDPTGAPRDCPLLGDRIALVVAGHIQLIVAGCSQSLSVGQAMWVPASAGPVSAVGPGSLVVAGQARPGQGSGSKG